jgi:ABC-type dipeptide/oligopeptide/nickel transport system ATPase component
MSDALLSISGLRLSIGGRAIVKGVNLDVTAGEIAGVVGESGSGKSMSALSILGLAPSEATVEGSIVFDGAQICGNPCAARKLRGRAFGYVPQEPMTSLNPTMRIANQLTWPARLVGGMPLDAARARAVEMLRKMQIVDAERVMNAFPFELSGGLRQRVLLAQAFMLRPRLVIADEPTTALDVTVQAEVLALLKAAARDEGAAVLLITHNMGVVWRICDRVHVMRHGAVVESGAARETLTKPKHPYTQGLCDALPERALRRTKILNP